MPAGGPSSKEDSVRHEGEAAPERDLVTVREAAEILGVPVATLRRAIKEGQLPGIAMGGGMWVVDLAEVERFGREHLRPTTDDQAMDDEDSEGVSKEKEL